MNSCISLYFQTLQTGIQYLQNLFKIRDTTIDTTHVSGENDTLELIKMGRYFTFTIQNSLKIKVQLILGHIFIAITTPCMKLIDYGSPLCKLSICMLRKGEGYSRRFVRLSRTLSDK